MEELPKKRKYIPESQLETQCDTDYEFVEQAYLEQNSQTYDDWEPGQENEDEINSAAEGTKKTYERLCNVHRNIHQRYFNVY
ncbi:unnamed protein product, partial [Iphiclides podalirius]